MGQERRSYDVVSWGFGWGSLYACKLRWVDLVGLGEECSGSGKLFECCVDVIVSMHNLFNKRLNLRTAIQARGLIFAQLRVIWVIVVRSRTGRQCDITVLIGGKFLVCAFTFHWMGAVWNSISTPNGCWCGTFGGGGIGGWFGRRGTAGAGRWVYLARTAGRYGRV